jgi:SAM-dependent methyltransferase
MFYRNILFTSVGRDNRILMIWSITKDDIGGLISTPGSLLFEAYTVFKFSSLPLLTFSLIGRMSGSVKRRLISNGPGFVVFLPGLSCILPFQRQIIYDKNHHLYKGLAEPMKKLKDMFFKTQCKIMDTIHPKFSSPVQYWSAFTVTHGKIFYSREDSLQYLNWRNSLYFNYTNLMPVSGHDNKVILDYGCGPGNDLTGFIEYSHPKLVFGADVSPKAIESAKDRLKFHHSDNVEFKLLVNEEDPLPFDSESIDYIHSSGVLHHVSDINYVLKEFYRILKPDGTIRIMIYNYNSIFLHLYVAYDIRRVKKVDADVPLEEAFKKSTDGRECPISRCYRPGEFVRLCSENGFDTTFVDAAVSTLEMSLLPIRFAALQDLSLEDEHRQFLYDLSFNDRGWPLYQGKVAGIDAVYELKKRK